MTARRPAIQQQPPRISTETSRISREYPKETLPFYKTQEWKQLVGRLIRKRGKFCQRCGHDCRMTRIFSDHVIEIKDGGALLEEDNIELLCSSCHTKKTLRKRMERSRR